MAESTPSPPPTNPSPAAPAAAATSAGTNPSPGPAAKGAINAAAASASTVKPAPVELTGFRSALSHTGIPHSVLTWKPKLPSRNWLIFWTITASLSGAYYYDRRECNRIKEETIRMVEGRGREVLEGGSLGSTRRVTVWGAKWGGDEDTDRALRYFRKYVKPYLVAAAIDYDLPTSPLHGSITRQVHASILAQRRQALGLEPLPPLLSLPGVLSPEETRKKELEGGVVLVGRASLKEYFEGLRRGWTGGVDAWDWEKSIESKLETDGVFAEPKPETEVLDAAVETPGEAATPESTEFAAIPAPSPPSTKPPTGLGFLSRPTPSVTNSSSPSASASAGPQIPPHWHIPPNPLPAQPPLLLLPFENHIGFTQIPAMIASFFNERYRVREGADAALALINSEVRPISKDDLGFDKKTEGYYNKAALELPKRIGEARKDYYDALAPRINEARAYENGTREMTEEEKKSGKVVKLDELKEERKKKELRWMGNEEGWEIVKPEAEVAWNEGWENWLKVFELPGRQSVGSSTKVE
ncbi:mitochondrial import inner membrane translocase subunit TIM54 [Kwoniella heveanensis CBS 569]|nr:mitochondrial import inner membrane translocase subunit TIM54 [Kwoniella heveanensis CBS 569]